MQSTPLNTTVPKMGLDEDAVPGFASNTPHKALVGQQAPAGKALKNLASDAAGAVRGLATEARNAAVEHADATAAWVGNSVKASPLRTLGIAVAIGAVIGLLIGRR
jgi:ElaB/YqjD/DUF883 family membrane-anchored ribosome-binding protein